MLNIVVAHNGVNEWGRTAVLQRNRVDVPTKISVVVVGVAGGIGSLADLEIVKSTRFGRRNPEA